MREDQKRRTQVLIFRWLHPQHFVIFMATWALLGTVCGYAISVGSGKVAAILPYISDTGTLPPASCIFGLMLNISAVFGVVVIFIRHRHFEGNILSDNEAILIYPRIHIVNDISMLVGLLSCLGMMVVACFQKTEVVSVHLLGAGMVFILGIIYCCLQSYLSYITIGIQYASTKLKAIIRIILSVVSAVGGVLHAVFGKIAVSQSKSNRIQRLRWKSNEPGYSNYVISSSCEWIMGLCFVLFFVTFYHEFKNVQLKVGILSRVTNTSQGENIQMAEQTGLNQVDVIVS